MTSLCRLTLLLALAHTAAISIFLRGFLLTRLELPNTSSCLDPELSNAAQASSSGSSCWSEAAFDRAVIIIIDALRYDFVFGGKNRPGRMPKLTGMLTDAGAAGVALKFVADTPTITMSRLKAILTGALPTFLDIGQSFSAAAISEDNLLAQMRTREMRVVVMGDDTWAQLAPHHHYAACHPYPAFDVRDLHTVDNGVWQHLLPYLRSAAHNAASAACGAAGGAPPPPRSNCTDPTDCTLEPGAHLSGSGAGGPSDADEGSSGADNHPGTDAVCSPADPDPHHSSETGTGTRTSAGSRTCVGGGSEGLSGTSPDGGSSSSRSNSGGDGGWEVLVAHYLGVDHAGHTYGGNSPEMYDKLRQMDEQVVTVAEELLAGAGDGEGTGPYSRTLLLVLGDHGQTLSGDHGGGSDEERDSVLLAFNMGRWGRARAGRRQRVGAAAAAAGAGCDAAAYAAVSATVAGHRSVELGEATQGAEPDAVPQIDLTPTLALLLGLPVPYGNLGKVNRRLWEMAHAEADRRTGRHMDCNGGSAAATAASCSTHAGAGPPCSVRSGGNSGSGGGGGAEALSRQRGSSYVAALRANAVQVARYLESYAARGGLPSGELEHCRRLLRDAHAGLLGLSPSGGTIRGGEDSDDGVEGGKSAGGNGAARTAKSNEEAEVVARYEAFLEAAGALARRKFTRFDLVSMALGCGLVVGCVTLHGWLLLARLRSWRDLLLLSPLSGGVAAAALLHSLGLFSANWIQGEGRIHCYSLAAAALLLWLLAAARVKDDADVGDGDDAAANATKVSTGPALQRCSDACSSWGGEDAGHGRQGCSGSCQAAEGVSLMVATAAAPPQPPAALDHQSRELADTRAATKGPQVPLLHSRHYYSRTQPITPQRRQQQRQQMQERQRRRRRAVWRLLFCHARLVGIVAVALACNIALQRYSLIDRWGSDPHDKRQLAAAGPTPGSGHSDGDGSGDGRARAEAASPSGAVLPPPRALLLAALETLAPLGLLPALLAAALRPRRYGATADAFSAAATAPRRQQQRQRRQCGRLLQYGWRRLQWRVLGAAPFHLVAAWWVVQLIGLRDLTLPALLEPAAAAALAPLRALLTAATPPPLLQQLHGFHLQLLQVWRVAARHPRMGWLRALSAAALALPVRLLLPRIVYGLAGLAALQLALLPALCAVALAMSGGKPPRERWHQRQQGQERQLETEPRNLAAGPDSDPAHTAYGDSGRGGGGRFGGAAHEREWSATGVARRRSDERGLETASLRGDVGSMGGAAADAEAVLDAVCSAVSSFTAVVALLLGRRGPAVMLLLWLHGLALFGLLLSAAKEPRRRRHRRQMPAAGLEAAAGGLLAALGTQAFFLTGHFCEFSGLQYDSPFVGFDHMSWPATPCLFWMNSFGATMLPALALPLAAAAVAASVTTAIVTGETTSPPPPDHGHSNTQDSHTQCHHTRSHSRSCAHHGRPMEEAAGGPAGDPPSDPGGGGPSCPGGGSCLSGGLSGRTFSGCGDGGGSAAAVTSGGRVLLVAVSGWRCLALCVAVLSAAVQRHHVVVWALFAPKLVFEVCFTAAVHAALMLVAPATATESAAAGVGVMGAC